MLLLLLLLLMLVMVVFTDCGGHSEKNADAMLYQAEMTLLVPESGENN